MNMIYSSHQGVHSLKLLFSQIHSKHIETFLKYLAILMGKIIEFLHKCKKYFLEICYYFSNIIYNIQG